MDAVLQYPGGIMVLAAVTFARVTLLADQAQDALVQESTPADTALYAFVLG